MTIEFFRPRSPASLASLLFFLLLSLLGCAAQTAQRAAPAPAEPPEPLVERTVEELPGPRPPWVDRVPEGTADALFFVGGSGLHAAEGDARAEAHRAAVLEFARHCGVRVTQDAETLTLGVGKASEVADPTVARRIRDRQLVDALVSRVKSSLWYSRRVERTRGSRLADTSWQAWVLVQVPRDEVERVREQRLAVVAEPYARAKALADQAAAARDAGRPLEALSSYLDGLEAASKAEALPEFAEAAEWLRGRGYRVPLGLEAEIQQTLAGLTVSADEPSLRLQPGDPLPGPLRVRAAYGGRPLAGIAVLFSGEGEERVATTGPDGLASFTPQGCPSWAEGNHAVAARADHPALRRAAGRFPVPAAVTFLVEVRAVAGAEAHAANQAALATVAERLGRAAAASPLAAELRTVGVAPASEGGAPSALGEEVGRALGRALAAVAGGPTVVDPAGLDAALAAYGVRAAEVLGADDSRLAGEAAQVGAMVVSELARDAERVRLSTRLLHVGSGAVVGVGEAVLQAAEWADLPAGPRASSEGLELAVGFFCETRFGGPRRLEEGAVLSSGDHYRLEFEPGRGAYVYAWQVDSQGTVIPLFPNAGFSPAGNPVPAGGKVSLPADALWWALDEAQGTEELAVVASRLPLRRVEQVFEALVRDQRLAGGAEARQALAGAAGGAAPAPAGERQVLVLGQDRRAHEVALDVLRGTSLGVVKRVRFTHR